MICEEELRRQRKGGGGGEYDEAALERVRTEERGKREKVERELRDA